MRIERIELEHLRQQTRPVVACIGYFDGVHKGHQALIKATIDKAKELNCESALITFDPDPWVTIKDIKDVKHITPLSERINLAVSFGIGNIYILSFTKAMADLSPEDFDHIILGSCNIRTLVCGFDFSYGRFGAGNIETLKASSNFDVIVVDAVEDAEGKISSTRITTLIENGEVDKAEQLLGYPFYINGYVKHGNAQGRKIGFPTANISFSNEYLDLKNGVYAGYVTVSGKRHRAMINVGHNPTFNYSRGISLEAHLLDFDKEIYDHRVKVEFKKYLREERKFQSILNLQMQLEQDEFSVRNLLDA